MDNFRMSIVEGTDAAFLIFLDALEDEDSELWELAEQLIGDRRGLMQKMRERYLALSSEGDSEQQRIIVETTNAIENIFFLLAQLTRDLQTQTPQIPSPADP